MRIITRIALPATVGALALAATLCAAIPQTVTVNHITGAEAADARFYLYGFPVQPEAFSYSKPEQRMVATLRGIGPVSVVWRDATGQGRSAP